MCELACVQRVCSDRARSEVGRTAARGGTSCGVAVFPCPSPRSYAHHASTYAPSPPAPLFPPTHFLLHRHARKCVSFLCVGTTCVFASVPWESCDNSAAFVRPSCVSVFSFFFGLPFACSRAPRLHYDLAPFSFCLFVPPLFFFGVDSCVALFSWPPPPTPTCHNHSRGRECVCVCVSCASRSFSDH